MKSTKERVNNILAQSTRTQLQELLNLKFSILLGGDNQALSGSYNPENFNEIQYTSNEISLIFEANKENKFKEISLMTTLLALEGYGEYDNLHLRIYEYIINNRHPHRVAERMLIKNRSLLNLNISDDSKIVSIDIYGPKVKEYRDFDPDFPNEERIINLDLDVLLKFNTNQNFFITCHAKGGRMLLTFYLKEELFNNYIAITKSWGELHNYKFKCSIE